MKRLFWFVGGVLAALVLVAGLVYLLSMRLPSLARTEPEARNDAPENESDERRSERALAETLAGLLGLDPDAADTTYRLLQEVVANGSVEIEAEELADLVETSLGGSLDGRAFARAADRPRARYDGDRVEVGAVVDLRELDEATLSARARDAVERIRTYAPFLADRPVWIAIDSAPFARDGDIDLGSNASFQIGSLPLPGFLARALGLDQQLRQALLLDLRFLSVHRVEVREELLYLEASPALASR